MGELPQDVQEALLKSAKQWLLGNYWGGQKRLTDPSTNRGHYNHLLHLRSWSLGDNRSKTLRRLRKLVDQGLLIERPYYRKDRRSCDFTVPTIEQSDAIYDQAFEEWKAVGYVPGELMLEIKP